MIDLRDRRDLQLLVDVVSVIRRSLPGEQPLLIGAMARDVLLYHAHGIRLERATRDIDFAFAVGSWQEFSAMREALVGSGAFKAVEGNDHQLLFRGKNRVDILAFGGVENSDHTLAWPPAGNVVMNVVGYREALADAVPVQLPDGEGVKVVSLPALAALKLFAWRDRRRSSAKDAIDLWSVLEHYLDAGNESRLYDEATHLFDDPAYDFRRAGAWLLGRDMRTLLSRGDGDALAQALELLGAEMDSANFHLARDTRAADLQLVVDLLRAMFSGLQGTSSPG